VRRARLLVLTLVAALLAGGLGGCGGSESEDFADRISARVRAEVEERRERFRERVEEVLGEIRRALPRAQRTDPSVQARGQTGTETIDGFLTRILQDIDAYWERTFAASDLPQPRVAYTWVAPGRRVATACGTPADDRAAFYCSADDTIYIAQVFAAQLYEGVAEGFPGQAAGFGRAAGDFGVAYVVAHEYAHNLQNELGLFTIGSANSTEPFELQADCMAGAWGYSVYETGQLSPADIEEAINTALAVGDFDVSSVNHHGTPTERRDAWLLGFESGDPSICGRYAPT
jgi:uncharacterized protein